MIERDIEKIKIKALTKRELEVLKLLSIGLYNKEIGERLSISERTVKNHISSIFKKIEVTDRTQAAVFSIRNKIVNVF
jgi:DNA-binding NarL/FixJ family response regulator